MLASRRKFLLGAAALSLAPAIAKADNIMRIKPPTLVLYGDGVHDDTHALQSILRGKRAWDALTKQWIYPSENVLLHKATYRISDTIHIDNKTQSFTMCDVLLIGADMLPGGTLFYIHNYNCDFLLRDVDVTTSSGLACWPAIDLPHKVSTK